MRLTIYLSALGILASASAMSLTSSATAQARGPVVTEGWEIGPVIRGRNYSVGMPLHPTPLRRGWYFDFPFPSASAGHVHYVTFPTGPLLGARKIRVRYRIDAASGVKFVPQEFPGHTAYMSLYFQRRGDTWVAKRRQYQWYRWYSPKHTMREVSRGVQEVTVNLDDPQWMSVYGGLASANPQLFREALADTGRVGLVFGHDRGGRGHGVFATGAARFTLLDFQIL